LSLDKRRPSKEQLPMWERRPSGNLGKFLAVARPRSGINTLIRVRPLVCHTEYLLSVAAPQDSNLRAYGSA
jgi:hypothetical protein